MSNKKNLDILTAFKVYQEAVFTLQTDYHFWQSFLQHAINGYKNRNTRLEEVFSAIFYAYDINPKTNTGLLKTYERTFLIKNMDLDEHIQNFFTWVTNLAIIKTYNALEVFLLQAIHLKYFPDYKNPIEGKKAVGHINKAIREYLKIQKINSDTTNNRHIIEFLKLQTTDIKTFLKLPVGIDFTTDWGNFFELISILRNAIAHQGTILSLDTQNEIKSKSNDIFLRHFALAKDDNDNMKLYPILDQFLNLISLYNNFAVNMVKLMYKENDLTMFKMI